MNKLQERDNYLIDRGRAYGKKGDLALPKMAPLVSWRFMTKLSLVALNVTLLILLLTACQFPLPEVHIPEANPDVLLNKYIAAFKARDLETFRTQIVSANYAHTKRDGSMEDQSQYLKKLQEIFKLTVREVAIIEKSATLLPGGCQINIHWKVTLSYGIFGFSTVELTDKTALIFKLEGVSWKLVEEAPMLKDGTLLDNGLTNKELDYRKLTSFSLGEKNVYVWCGFHFTPEFINLTHLLHIKWYDPTGKLYFDNLNFFTPKVENWAQWSPLPVQGKIPVSLQGNWKVQVYLDDLYKFETEFTLASP